MKRATFLIAIAIAITCIALTVVPSRQVSGERSWLVVLEDSARTGALVEAIEARGGRVTRVHAAIGVLVASSERAGFARDVASLEGVEGVGPDLRSVRADGASNAFGVVAVGPEVEASESGDGSMGGDPYSMFQWNLDAINAPQAWAEGARGEGVLVAVLDTGINPAIADLAGAVRMDLAASFVPGEGVDVMPLPPPPRSFANAHGTMVAGVIAARQNGIGMIGVAPLCEILPVKVLSQYTGYGTWDYVIAGIVHAADNGAQVINMSLGGTYDRRGGWDDNGTPGTEDDVWFTASEVAAVVNALQRAVTYAHDKGAVVVAAAGNSANDGDHDADQLNLPACLAHVLSVSATAPYGWWLDHDTDLDLLAPYSNYGQSEIDLAAPGGSINSVPFGGRDGVFGPVPAGGFVFASGTSFAAPHVAGVAALVIGANGGSMGPAQVEAVLRRSAADLGKRGRDDAYGHGRVDAWAAVR